MKRGDYQLRSNDFLHPEPRKASEVEKLIGFKNSALLEWIWQNNQFAQDVDILSVAADDMVVIVWQEFVQ